MGANRDRINAVYARNAPAPPPEPEPLFLPTRGGYGQRPAWEAFSRDRDPFGALPSTAEEADLLQREEEARRVMGRGAAEREARAAMQPFGMGRLTNPMVEQFADPLNRDVMGELAGDVGEGLADVAEYFGPWYARGGSRAAEDVGGALRSAPGALAELPGNVARLGQSAARGAPGALRGAYDAVMGDPLGRELATLGPLAPVIGPETQQFIAESAPTMAAEWSYAPGQRAEEAFQERDYLRALGDEEGAREAAERSLGETGWHALNTAFGAGDVAALGGVVRGSRTLRALPSAEDAPRLYEGAPRQGETIDVLAEPSARQRIEGPEGFIEYEVRPDGWHIQNINIDRSVGDGLELFARLNQEAEAQGAQVLMGRRHAPGSGRGAIEAPSEPPPLRALRTPQERADWANEAMVRMPPDELSPAEVYGFRGPQDRNFMVEVRPRRLRNGQSFASVEFQDVDTSPFLDAHEAQRRFSPTEARQILNRVVAALEEDIATNARPEYVLAPQSPQHAAVYSAMARAIKPPAGYRIEQGANGAIWITREGAPSARGSSLQTVGEGEFLPDAIRRMPLLEGATAIGAGGAAGALLSSEAQAEDGEGGDPLNPDAILPILGGGATAATLYALGRGRLARNLDNQVGMFAGVNARTADRAALARAEEMAAQGASRDEIWAETGWFKGVDGQWRFEIDDSGTRLSDEALDFFYRGEAVGETTPYTTNARGVLQHPELYEAYPELGGRATRIERTTDDPFSYHGDYTPGSGMIRMNAPDSAAARSGLLHESQHAIQREEGFATGGSPDRGNRLADIERFARQAYEEAGEMTDDQLMWELGGMEGPRPPSPTNRPSWDELTRRQQIEHFEAGRSRAYRHLAGEAEARNVEYRRDLTPEERRARPPWETEDVPSDQQIVRFDSTRAESRPAQRGTGPDQLGPEADIAGPSANETPQRIGGETGTPRVRTGREIDESLRFWDDRLSDQENFVARLALQGRTNRQIAEAMAEEGMAMSDKHLQVVLAHIRSKAPDLNIGYTERATDGITERVMELYRELYEQGLRNRSGRGGGDLNAVIAERISAMTGEPFTPYQVSQRLQFAKRKGWFNRDTLTAGGVALGGAALLSGEDAEAGQEIPPPDLEGAQIVQGSRRTRDMGDHWEHRDEVILADGRTVERIQEQRKDDWVMGPPRWEAIDFEPPSDPEYLARVNADRPILAYEQGDAQDIYERPADLMESAPPIIRGAAALAAGQGARWLGRRLGARPALRELTGAGTAGATDWAMGGSPEEIALAAGVTPALGLSGEVAADVVGRPLAQRAGASLDDWRLRSNPQFRSRRDAFAATLGDEIPQVRALQTENYSGDIVRPDEGLFGEPPLSIPDREAIEEGFFRDVPSPNIGTQREQFFYARPAVQRQWMEEAGWLDPVESSPARLRPSPERLARGQEVQERVAATAPQPSLQGDPFIEQGSGRSIFGEERTPRTPKPLPPLDERAATGGSQGALRGVRAATLREIAGDLGISTEGVKAGDLRRTLVRQLPQLFDSTRELVAFLQRYGIKGIAAGGLIGGAALSEAEASSQ